MKKIVVTIAIICTDEYYEENKEEIHDTPNDIPGEDGEPEDGVTSMKASVEVTDI